MLKKHKKLKITGIILLSLVAVMVIINVIPPSKVMENNPFIANGNVMIAAHRGGSVNNPENTKKAFEKSVNDYGVDIIESDLYLTLDNHLVFNHNEYIDETANTYPELSYDELLEHIKDDNNKHYIKDMTLEELKQYNFGYYFTDENGNRPYQNCTNYQEEGLQIIELKEMFSMFYESNPDLLFILEIKDEEERGMKATDIFMNVLNSSYSNYKNNIVIGTFHDEIEAYICKEYPEIMRGASTGVAAGFIVTEMLKVNLFNNASFACLQIPMEFELTDSFALNLSKRQYIKRAHRRNIAVQFWTINEREDMEFLIDLGCDAIITDNPKLLKEVLGR